MTAPAAHAHAPVLLTEATGALEPRDGGIYVDMTFGAGGYTRALLATDGARVIAIDRDPRVADFAAAQAKAEPTRFVFAQAPFSALDAVLDRVGADRVDGVVMDLGVSSMQIDEAERGFSFQADGPLDMRMAQDGRSAADIVNEASQAELAEIFWTYGEEKRARRVAQAIVNVRADGAITTTGRLASVVAAAVGRSDGRIHPATRAFQALRIAVNDELGELEDALLAAERRLRPGGRLAVVSFHSLEDRIVKAFLRTRSGGDPGPSRHAPAPVEERPAPTFTILRGRPDMAGEAELETNPRARSAKLRVGVRTPAPAWDEGLARAFRPALMPARPLKLGERA